MITIIDKDGTEFRVQEDQSNQIDLPRKGRHDLDVACYRGREWILTTMSQLQVGDFFRVLNKSLPNPENLMLVTSRPKVFPHPCKPNGQTRDPDPDIALGGVSLSNIRAAYAKLGSPLISSIGLPFSPELLRLL